MNGNTTTKTFNLVRIGPAFARCLLHGLVDTNANCTCSCCGGPTSTVGLEHIQMTEAVGSIHNPVSKDGRSHTYNPEKLKRVRFSER